MDNFEEIDIFKNGHFQNYGQFGKMQMDNFWKNGQFLEKWTISGKMDYLDSWLFFGQIFHWKLVEDMCSMTNVNDWLFYKSLLQWQFYSGLTRSGIAIGIGIGKSPTRHN